MAGKQLGWFRRFSRLQRAAGTRRGIVPDAAADAFVAALATVEPQVEIELHRLEQERAATTDRRVLLDLRRALRGLRHRLPQYELLAAPTSPVMAAAPDEGVIPDVDERGDGDEAGVTDSGAGFGVPEPELVDDRASGWRSRFVRQRWQVNAGHEDYVALRTDGRQSVTLPLDAVGS